MTSLYQRRHCTRQANLTLNNIQSQHVQTVNICVRAVSVQRLQSSDRQISQLRVSSTGPTLADRLFIIRLTIKGRLLKAFKSRLETRHK